MYMATIARSLTKTDQRAKRQDARKKKLETGSMTAFYRAEEMNKGRLKSRRDRRLTS